MSQRLRIGEETVEYALRRSGDGAMLAINGHEIAIDAIELSAMSLSFKLDGKQHSFEFVSVGAQQHFTDGTHYRYAGRAAAEQESVEAQGSIVSHMPGKVLRVLVAEGERVEQGRGLIILEAMKMEHTLSAPAAGTVLTLPKGVGERVMPGDLLVELELDA